jgi:hypothetical protein
MMCFFNNTYNTYKVWSKSQDWKAKSRQRVGGMKIKWPKQDRQNWFSSMSDGGILFLIIITLFRNCKF